MSDFCIYDQSVRDKLKDKFGYSNDLSIPKLEKVVLSMGVGKAVVNKKIITEAVECLTLISGQQAVPTFAKKSISTFKLRAGMPIGCKVTLRRDVMFNFLKKFLYIALPRSRDLKGFSRKQFDGNGNFSCGVRDHTIFPEVEIGKLENSFGLNVSVITTARTDEECYELLSFINFPFFN